MRRDADGPVMRWVDVDISGHTVAVCNLKRSNPANYATLHAKLSLTRGHRECISRPCDEAEDASRLIRPASHRIASHIARSSAGSCEGKRISRESRCIIGTCAHFPTLSDPRSTRQSHSEILVSRPVCSPSQKQDPLSFTRSAHWLRNDALIPDPARYTRLYRNRYIVPECVRLT